MYTEENYLNDLLSDLEYCLQYPKEIQPAIEKHQPYGLNLNELYSLRGILRKLAENIRSAIAHKPQNNPEIEFDRIKTVFDKLAAMTYYGFAFKGTMVEMTPKQFEAFEGIVNQLHGEVVEKTRGKASV